MTNQKVAIITGGSSGLGFATAHRLLKEGMQVIITGRNRGKLLEAKEALGDDCHAIDYDIADIDHCEPFVQDIVNRFGRIDILVNNAGINQKKPILDVSKEDFEQILRVNTTGVFVLTQEVIKVMLQQASRGSIVNISSMAAQYGIPYIVSYSTSKTAIDGMTRALAVELGETGIRVNAIAPGFIRTPMSSKALDNDPLRKQKVLSRTPMARLGEPEDVANAVAFLVSDQASFIHGVILRVDGGNAIGF